MPREGEFELVVSVPSGVVGRLIEGPDAAGNNVLWLQIDHWPQRQEGELTARRDGELDISCTNQFNAVDDGICAGIGKNMPLPDFSDQRFVVLGHFGVPPDAACAATVTDVGIFVAPSTPTPLPPQENEVSDAA